MALKMHSHVRVSGIKSGYTTIYKESPIDGYGEGGVSNRRATDENHGSTPKLTALPHRGAAGNGLCADAGNDFLKEGE